MGKKYNGPRNVYQFKNGVLGNKVIGAEVETPEGYYDLIRDAKANPEELRGLTTDDGNDSPAAEYKGAALKEFIAGLTDVETLGKIVSLDSRTGAQNAATARLAELAE